MDITNKSRKPLSVPLPGGKKLFLGPGKTGQVSPKALDHRSKSVEYTNRSSTICSLGRPILPEEPLFTAVL